MEFDDLIKKRLMELEEHFRKLLEGSAELTDIKEYLADNGYHAVLCLMTFVYRSPELEVFDEDFFEEEIDEQIERDFSVSICESDKKFFKNVQDLFEE